jgi:beta-glucosidase
MTHQEATQKASALISRMTIDEQASQLRFNAPAIDRLGIPGYNWWNEALHGVARAGTATVFPQAIGLAAIFDADFHGKVADVIATEARAKFNAQQAKGDLDIYKGISFWSPNINIFRDPRWGRGQETYGEDPYLTSRLGVAFVKHLQGEGEYLKAGACAKHFAVHSGPENIRHEFNAVVSEKDLRETYLPAFEALVREADVESVMGAYNRVNDEPACGSKRLLTDILREEWGFEGHVVSDCWAIADFHMHHFVTATAPQSAALAIRNGCDLNCGNTYLHLLTALQEGLINEEMITLAATRVMAARYRLGLLSDNCEYNAIPYSACDTDENAAVALEAAQKSIVLLKNDGILPLCTRTLDSIAVIGPNADSVPALEGNYNGVSSRYVTFLEGIRAACSGGPRVRYSQGSHLYRDRANGLSNVPGDRLAEAASLAEECDVSVLCLGLDSTIEGEEGDASNEFSSGDRKDICLPECQQQLLNIVLKAGKPVIVVLACGGAVNQKDGSAILQAWYPGQAGGTALADILFGRVSPGGRMPITVYRSLDDVPAFINYSMANRTYRNFAGEALYPFGYGLSYSRFEYSQARLDGLRLTVTVRNTGRYDADEVAQAYIKVTDSPDDVRNHSLCGFTRFHLKKGEEKTITMDIPESALLCVCDDGVKRKTGSRYALTIGGSQPDPVSVRLTGCQPARLEFTR